MHVRFLSSVLLLAVTCVPGCSRESEESAQSSTQPATTPATPGTRPIDGTPTLTEETLRAFEEKRQCRLPGDYRSFLLKNNGGIPSPNCVTFEESGRTTASDVFCFHAIGDERSWVSVDWHLESFADRLPKETIPIAHDWCGNLWLLNIGPEQAGSVVFWDHGSYANVDETDIDACPRVANTFREFVDSLHEYQPLPEEEEIQSRYALVQQATEGMRERSPEFSREAARDFVWHCTYGDDGKVTMECVKYQFHAMATHTDGYSQLRAAKGLIEAGPPRLPE